MTVANTVKDVSRAISALSEQDQDNQDITGVYVRVAANLAYTMGDNVRLHKVTRRDVAIALAAHGYAGHDITRTADIVARRIRGMADEYGRLSATI